MAIHMLALNKAIEVREALGLTPTECGKIFIGGNNPYRAWKKLEDSGNWNSGTEKMLNLILILVMAKDHKTKNCHGALDLVLKTLEQTDDIE